MGAGFVLPRDAGPHREDWPEVGAAGRCAIGAVCRPSPPADLRRSLRPATRIRWAAPWIPPEFTVP